MRLPVNRWRNMRNRLLASLIACVALLTQLGASFWGAAAARDGYAGCHRRIAPIAATEAPPAGKGVPSGVPSSMPGPHDHGSCSLCQLGFAVIDGEPPILPSRSVAIEWRIVLLIAETPPLRSVFNRSAPARAPPFQA